MRLIIFALFISALAFGSVSELQRELEKKSKNYEFLHNYYSELLADVKAGNSAAFCSTAKTSVALLSNILEDDQVLMKTLRSSTNPDYLEYATHIEENSISPLFSTYAFIDTCDNNPGEILKLGQSLQYHVTNIDYLDMVNELFSQSVKQ